MAKHARFGPSRLDGLSKCVRFRHIEMLGAAAEGTEMHAAFETGDMAGLNEEQRSVVQQALDYVGSLMADDSFIELKETKLELDELTYGTADRVLISRDGKTGHVMDFKGIRVGSDHEFQVRTYAAAVLEKYPDMELITTHVLAPRLGQGPITAEYGRPLLAAVRGQIEELYAKIDDPWNPPTAHEDYCGICANSVGCPALAVTISKVIDLTSLPVPSSFEPTALVSERDRLIAQVLAGVFANWATIVKKNNAAYVADNGGEVPGFKLVQRSTGLRIPKENTPVAVSVIKERFGLTTDDLLSAMTLSLSDLCEQLNMDRGGSKAEYKEDLRDALGDLTTESVARYLQKNKRIQDAQLLEENV